MKYFLDSAKLDEIKEAYNTFGIDGVTTNPRHIQASGKPFLKAINDIAEWIKEEGIEGYETFPVSVEINPHLDKDSMHRGRHCGSPHPGKGRHPHQCHLGLLTGSGHTACEKRFTVCVTVYRLEGSQWRRLQKIH